MAATNHLEIRGNTLLECLIEKYKPESITIEFPSNYSLKDIEEYVSAVSKVKNTQKLDVPENLRKFFAEFRSNKGYDAIVPIKYARSKDIEVYPVDHLDVASIISPNDVEITQERVNGILETIPPQIWQMTYDEFRKELIQEADRTYFNPEALDAPIYSALVTIISGLLTKESLTRFAQLFEPEFAERREAHMAQKISEIEPDLHIGGIIHVFESHSNMLPVKPLYKRLEEKNVPLEKIRLCEAAKYC